MDKRVLALRALQVGAGSASSFRHAAEGFDTLSLSGI
jgi:hypothetical protein